MRTLVLVLAISAISIADATQQVSEANFWSVYFTHLWQAIRHKFVEVKHFFEREIPRLVRKVQEEVPKFVATIEAEVPKIVETIETEVPRFVESLHLDQKTEALANATGEVKRFFGDLWDFKVTNAVESLKEVFIVILVVASLALVSYLYLECFLFRKLLQLLIAIPRLLYEILRAGLKKVWQLRKKKPNYVHVYKDGKVYVNIV
ncbi:hypothetical protein QR680_018542 [Steinernema hermaphroditum]|uniref:SXP/RAL-2 family protein Ani s 5-like cation-binding domain-containing protein n=1 Tax=Steinernema hermaphroditum TaxID=289476 RepID=A0AA39LR66_9BILA|nr:hypothetical protein QR680_018542 [Steinernema hermaphroditum]